jgi:hypothetical protein
MTYRFNPKRIIAEVDYVKGYLRYGYYEVIINSEAEYEVYLTNPKDFIRNYGTFIVDDYEITDIGDPVEIFEEN